VNGITDRNTLQQRAMEAATVVVVKIGSGVVAPGGKLDPAAVSRLGADLAAVRRTGRQVIVVSSGAIASGFRLLGLRDMPKDIAEKQAAAAVGQQILMQAWAHALKKAQLTVAQVLLTADDLDHRTRYLNARHTFLRLLAHGVMPIVNENDSVSYAEIRMGDNDHLSALVTTLVSAHLLIMLSVADGLRRGGPSGELIDLVRPADAAGDNVSKDKSATGVGGMRTKLEAARLVNDAGIPAVIAAGTQPRVLSELLAGKAHGTWFEPKPSRLDPRRRWLATATRPRGVIVVDDGARRAIVERNASLLPSGIVGVEGHFPAGSVVRIADGAGLSFARGLASYASDEIMKVKGRKGADLPALLGYRYMDEIVHRNDLVVEG
jgi:glutamate 5-kinase